MNFFSSLFFTSLRIFIPIYRAHFALQLLEMAKFFTSNPLGLALYPTGSATVFIFLSFIKSKAKYSCASLL
jgi:hypothetical protein